MNRLEAIERAKEWLNHPEFCRPSDAAYLLMDYIDEIKEENLCALAWLLAHEEYGCHKNDVLGLIELMENTK